MKVKISGDKIVNTSFVFIVRQLMWSKLEKSDAPLCGDK